MKRYSFLFVMLLMAIGHVSAGDNFYWGINGGMNISKADPERPGFLDTGWETEESKGYWVGLQFRVAFPVTGFGFDFGLNYSQENLSVTTDSKVSSSVKSEYLKERLEYINVPIHLRYDLELPAISAVIIPFAFAGPEMNYSLSDLEDLANESPHNLWGSGTVSKKTEEAFEASKLVWKMDLGFGVLLFGHLQVAYNYAIPLNDSFKFSSKTYEESKTNFKMGTHRIGATIFF